MKFQKLLVLALVCLLVFCLSFASAEIISLPIQKMTGEELRTLRSDISKAEDLYHDASSSQRTGVSNAVERALPRALPGASSFSYSSFSKSISRHWDFYKYWNSVTYDDQDGSRTSHDLYAEVYANAGGGFDVTYLTIDKQPILDKRAAAPKTLWIKTPGAVTNKKTGLNLSALPYDTLEEIRAAISNELSAHHSTKSGINNQVKTMTQNVVENYYMEKGYNVSWPWIDYTYDCEWDLYMLTTRADYKPNGGKKVKDPVYAEAYPFDGEYRLTYLTAGGKVLIDKRSTVKSPLYDKDAPDMKFDTEAAAKKKAAEEAQQAQAAAEEAAAQKAAEEKRAALDDAKAALLGGDQTAEDVSVAGRGIDLDLSGATDEELAQAILAIQEEQRARIHAALEMDIPAVKLKKGGTITLSAEVYDLPDGVTHGELTWTTSDPAVCTLDGADVTAIAPGTAEITCTATLSDGTTLSDTCIVTVR